MSAGPPAPADKSDQTACLLQTSLRPCVRQGGRKAMKQAICNAVLHRAMECCRKVCLGCPLMVTEESLIIPVGGLSTYRRRHAGVLQVTVTLHRHSGCDRIRALASVMKNINMSTGGQLSTKTPEARRQCLIPCALRRCDGPISTVKLARVMVDLTTRHRQRASSSHWLELQVPRILPSPVRSLHQVLRRLDTATESRRVAAS